MKIYVMVDLEGISGVYTREQVSSVQARYVEGRKFMTMDINACVEGLARGGADEIIVQDAHGGSSTAIWEDLDPRAECIMGSFAERMPCLEGSDGLVLLGYHAMAGTDRAVLEHTMSSRDWQNFWINDRKCGEMAIDGGIAGDRDIPVIMVSGCDKACLEAREFFPGVHTAQVKTALGIFGAKLLSAQKAHMVIEQTAEKAAKACADIAPYKPERPVRMKLELIERGTPPEPSTRPWMEIIDARTFEVKGDSVEEAFCRLRS